MKYSDDLERTRSRIENYQIGAADGVKHNRSGSEVMAVMPKEGVDASFRLLDRISASIRSATSGSF